MNNQSRIEKIETLIEKYELEKALEIINNLLIEDEKHPQILCLKGKIRTKQQQYGDAMNIYNSVLKINPENEKARTSINIINNILAIKRTFYFENTYTDDGLYE